MDRPIHFRQSHKKAPVKAATRSSKHVSNLESSAKVRSPIVDDGERATSQVAQEGINMFVTDTREESNGRIYVFGISDTQPAGSILVHVNDFRPYFYFRAPSYHQAGVNVSAADLTEMHLAALTQFLNRAVPADSRVSRLVPVHRIPIMHYRAASPGPLPVLQAILVQGGSVRKASAAVGKLLFSSDLRAQGFHMVESTLFEHEIPFMQRFLADTGVCGGAWLHVPAACDSCDVGFTPREERVSRCTVEVEAPWSSIQCLSPDASQLADENWQPQLPKHYSGKQKEDWKMHAASAAAGRMAELRMMTFDVIVAPADGSDRAPVAATDPVVAISCILHTSAAVPSGESDTSSPSVHSDTDDEMAEAEGDEGSAEEAHGSAAIGAAAETAVEITSGVGLNRTMAGVLRKVVFVLAVEATSTTLFERVYGAEVRLFQNERQLLRAWQEFVREENMDAFALFEVHESLGAVQARFQALKISGGDLSISRLQGVHAKPATIRKLTQYSAAWVRSQSRMTSTSNQETWRADIAGVIVFDVLRHILSTCTLASFSLVDAGQSLLGHRLEVLPPSAAAALSGLAPSTEALAAGPPLPPEAAALRLAAYSVMRCGVVLRLLRRMATVTETVELARATGLALDDILYRAQMIRTYSLLIRTAGRNKYMIGGRMEPAQLQESPYLMHPVETGAVGLYKTPVAVLDFASLYPSLYRAYNLCYTTLLHPEDVSAMDPDDVFTSPTGDKFVKANVRPGLLPAVLKALIQARSATRQQLQETSDPWHRTVLDSRQKAIKLVSNALYGFTGAQTSPLQCRPLADSCLALGRASMGRAIAVLHESAAAGDLGPKGDTARVIYGQTDSTFLHMPDATAAEAVVIGQKAAQLVTSSFPPEISIKFERVMCPFLLLHVNRYAGCSFEQEEEASQGHGQLLVKGLKSTWRMAPLILRSTMSAALRRIIMHSDVSGAVRVVEEQIQRLLSGRAELWELVMTGGLWRVTGKDIREAAEGDAKSAAIRGPHARLAVRLQQRDPGRDFVLGQRIQYVLLPGERLQDDASEDPLTAAKAGAIGNGELIWRHKMLRPLQELFTTCLSASELQDLIDGPHTKVRPDSDMLGALADASGGGKGSAAKQTALGSFYKKRAKCLGGCKRTMPSSVEGSEQPFCSFCAAEDGKATEVWLRLTNDASEAEKRQQLALSSCLRCHSGGLQGVLLCENGGCPVFHTRMSTSRRLKTMLQSQRRMEEW